MSRRDPRAAAGLLGLVIGCAFAAGALFGATLAPQDVPSFTPTAIALTECRRPEWVIFVSPKGWHAIRWARLQAEPRLRRAYGELARRRLEAGCGGNP